MDGTAIDAALLARIGEARRFGARTLAIATRLLVHGDAPKRVASEFGVALPRVYAIRKEVVAAAAALELPPGWARAELVGPRALVEHHRALFDAALARARRAASDAA